MRSRDLTLSASLMALYVAILIIGSTTPFKFTGLMLSALFGLFWNYFSIKQNLTFQAGRFAYTVSRGITTAPRIAALIKVESITGLAFLDWFNSTAYPIDPRGIEMLTATGMATATPILSLIVIVSLFHCLILPYVFFRYFERIGIFKRLPSF